jgi:hypothetical protein
MLKTLPVVGFKRRYYLKATQNNFEKNFSTLKSRRILNKKNKRFF